VLHARPETIDFEFLSSNSAASARDFRRMLDIVARSA
jgi:hypothetical protein